MYESILDVSIPRELIDEVLPESFTPQTAIEELGKDKLIGCLRRIPRDEATVYENALSDKKLKWTSLIAEDRAYIIYYAEMTDRIRHCVRLEMRDLDLEGPPLSLKEHCVLATAYGVSEESQAMFVKQILSSIREQGLPGAFKDIVQTGDYRPHLYLEPEPVDSAEKKKTDRVVTAIFKNAPNASIHGQETAEGWHWDVYPIDEEEAVRVVNYLAYPGQKVTSLGEVPEGTKVEFDRAKQLLTMVTEEYVFDNILQEQDEDPFDPESEPLPGELGDEYPYDGEEEPLEVGEDVPVNTGDKISSSTYGEFWVTKAGVVGGLWTSEDEADIESGQGRGLRYNYVDAIQREGKGPWYDVEYQDDGIYRVTGIRERVEESYYYVGEKDDKWLVYGVGNGEAAAQDAGRENASSDGVTSIKVVQADTLPYPWWSGKRTHGHARAGLESDESAVEEQLPILGPFNEEEYEGQTHSACASYEALPNKDGWGKCSTHGSEVEGGGPACPSFKPRVATEDKAQVYIGDKQVGEIDFSEELGEEESTDNALYVCPECGAKESHPHTPTASWKCPKCDTKMARSKEGVKETDVSGLPEADPRWQALFDEYSRKGCDPADAAFYADEELKKVRGEGKKVSADGEYTEPTECDDCGRQLRKTVDGKYLYCLMCNQPREGSTEWEAVKDEWKVLHEAVHAVEMTVRGTTGDEAEILLPGMKAIPVNLQLVRDWVEDNWGKGDEVAPNRTLTQDVDTSLLYDFLTGPGVDVNEFTTERPPERIASSDDLDRYFKKLSGEKPPEAPPEAPPAPLPPSPSTGGASAPKGEEEGVETDWQTQWVVLTPDSCFVSDPMKKQDAMGMKAELEAEGLNVIMVPAEKVDELRGRAPQREED